MSGESYSDADPDPADAAAARSRVARAVLRDELVDAALAWSAARTAVTKCPPGVNVTASLTRASRALTELAERYRQATTGGA